MPVIFASGDDRLAKDLQTMPWIEFVTVKIATGADTAELLPVDEVRAELQQAARLAIESRSQARVMTLTTPIQAGLHAVPPARLDQLEGIPGINYAEDTVTFEAEDFQSAFHGIEALIHVATRGYIRLYNEVLREHPAGPEIRGLIRNAIDKRWYDYESGRWTPPEPQPPDEEQSHFGYR